MHVRRHAAAVEVLAPAKINLFLEVLGKRPDGYHEIETLLVPVTVYDSLFFAATADSQIVLECRSVISAARASACLAAPAQSARELHPSEVPAGPENLAWRAAALVQERAGLSQGAVIRLVKRIPAAAGLGGASSDAAAALVAASAGWGLDWPGERLVELARELGSDVPFFLAQRAAMGRGRGDRIEEVSTTRLPMVIVKPPEGLSTPRVYQACQPADVPQSAKRMCALLASGRVAELGRELFNRLEAPAAGLTPWIGRLRDEFQRQVFKGHQMSGSGSSYFGICRSRRHARRVAAVLAARRLGEVMTVTAAG